MLFSIIIKMSLLSLNMQYCPRILILGDFLVHFSQSVCSLQELRSGMYCMLYCILHIDSYSGFNCGEFYRDVFSQKLVINVTLWGQIFRLELLGLVGCSNILLSFLLKKNVQIYYIIASPKVCPPSIAIIS